ncbi:caspase domain-containing protein [Streptomyces longwoodensis]|uniref:caspase family protein n=1 Tax=Streptomyces longwoodensis TaxID=68231 RepID=UPI0036F65048
MSASRHALIVANADYDDPGLKELASPASDASALAHVLGDPQIGDFEVEVVTDAPSHVIQRRIEGFFTDRRRDDTLVLHFSCHGLKSESGELYLAARDTEPRYLDATAVPSYFVRRCMSRTRAGSTVLFLDCCYGGAFSKGSAAVRAAGDAHVLDSFTAEKPPRGRGWAVITASTAMQYAMEGGRLTEDAGPPPSVFTHAVVEGLQTGDADLDADGEVSLDDLYEYLYEHVREQNPNQTPSKTVEMQGGLQLAHSPHRRISVEPADIRPEMRSAVQSRNTFTRLGAVRALRDQLADDRLPVAEGARRALEEMARGDVEDVAHDAEKALSAVRLRPSATRLDFGRVVRDSAVPHRTVTLEGVPLARCCLAHATAPWLRVAQDDDALDVGVDPGTVGHLSGDIVLKGVADDAVVTVEVDVRVPDRPPVDVPPGPAGAAAGSVPAGRTPDTPTAVTPVPAPVPPPSDRVVIRPQEPPGEPPPVITHCPGPQTPPAAVTGPPPPSRPPPSASLRDRPTVVTDRPAPAAERPSGAHRYPAPDPRPGRARGGPMAAVAALGLAAASVVMCVLAAVNGLEALRHDRDDWTDQDIDYWVHHNGALSFLVTCLFAAAASLLLAGLARYAVEAHRTRYTDGARSATHTLVSTARLFAFPVLVLAGLAGLAYLVGSTL